MVNPGTDGKGPPQPFVAQWVQVTLAQARRHRLPGWAVVGLRGWANLSDHVQVSAAVENIGDVDYRIMDSGANEPGINFIMTLQARW